MSEAGERQRAKAEEDTFASGAKPRLEERVRERGWRPTGNGRGVGTHAVEAARRRAIEHGRQDSISRNQDRTEAVE